jgi:hypothetical protein
VAEFASAMKFHPTIWVFFCAFTIALSARQKIVEPEKGVISFKMLKCDVNPKFIFTNHSCFAKSYSRILSTATVAVYFKQPVYEVYVGSKRLRFEIETKLNPNF